MKNDVKLKGWLQSFINWPLYLGVLVLFMTGIAYAADIRAGLVCTVAAAGYFVIAFWFYLVKRPLIMRELLVFAVNHAQIQKQLLSDLDVPYALLDEQGRILWINNAFGEIVKKDRCLRKKITDLFPELETDQISSSPETMIFDIAFENRYYRLHLKNIYMTEEGLREDEEEG